MPKRKRHLRCTKKSCERALQEYFSVERSFVKYQSFADASTYHKYIQVWNENNTLPETPFAVGVYYEKNQILIPVRVVTTLSVNYMGSTSIADLNKISEEYKQLGEIISLALNYIRDIKTKQSTMTDQNRQIGRAVLWNLCKDEDYPSLAKIEKHYNISSKTTHVRDPNFPLKPEDFQDISCWIRSHAESLL